LTLTFEDFQYALGHARRLRPDDALVRAIGDVRTVFDATAGLGRDSAALALAGYEVTSCERAPAMVALWSKARLPKRMRFVEGDARLVLRGLAPPGPEAVLIDPMYPDDGDRKSAPSKELVALRALVGDDNDAAELLAVAREVAQLRVVVKRPKKAPALAPDPSHSWEGASTRYDLYLRRAPGSTP
jgi:16S rRNA (guanine1516-N2)-methyltransferase